MDLMLPTSQREKNGPEGVWGFLLALFGVATIGYGWLLDDDLGGMALPAFVGGVMIVVGGRGAMRGLRRHRALRRSQAERAPMPTANLPRLQSSAVSGSVAVPSSASTPETLEIR